MDLLLSVSLWRLVARLDMDIYRLYFLPPFYVENLKNLSVCKKSTQFQYFFSEIVVTDSDSNNTSTLLPGIDARYYTSNTMMIAPRFLQSGIQ